LPSERDLQTTNIETFLRLACADERWALMYSLNGRNDLARYADRSTYTGTPLPGVSATCPSIPNLQLCGGACGACSAGYMCMGRSPLHPYSLCVNKWSSGGQCDRSNPVACSSPAGYRCMTYKVDAVAQPVADAYSFCVDKAICDAAAQSYPGGVFCTGGS
jgi:hypothetical protein